MSLKSLVSIVIPCYNNALYIEQSINSAYYQTYRNKEIIVVDDGSNQETKIILQELKDKIDRLITQDNHGVVESRNTAINLAKGEYILTLDSDDFFESKFLKKAVKILDDNESVGMVTCWTRILDSQGNRMGIMKHSGAPAEKAIFFNNASGCLLFRKSCWEAVGGYDENLKHGDEDWEFNVAVAKKGVEVHVIEEELFNYRKREGSRHSSAKKYQREIRKYAFTKHKDLLIDNFDKTLDFFLDEIESKERAIKNLKESGSYRIGSFFIKPWHFVKNKFRTKNSIRRK